MQYNSARSVESEKAHNVKKNGLNHLMPISKTVLKPNSPLPFPIFAKDGTLLVEKGIALNEQQIMNLLRKDKLLTKQSELLAALQKIRGQGKINAESTNYKAKTPFAILASLESELKEIFTVQDSPLTLSNIYAAAGRVQTICNQWPDSAIAKIFMDDKSNYTIQHSIHTAILCDLAAKHLGWQEDARRSLVGAALTMNISLRFLQDELQKQKEVLTSEQQVLLKEHPIKSAMLLENIGITETLWLDLIRTHHEQADGSGYPNRLNKSQLPKGAQILQLADMYGAKISGRKYRDAVLPTDAARYFFSIKDKNEYGILLDVFLKIIGLYPPGSIVRLRNDEIAMVVKRGSKIDKPMVRSLTNKEGLRLGSPATRNTTQPLFSIVEFAQLPLDFGDLDYDALWGFTRQ